MLGFKKKKKKILKVCLVIEKFNQKCEEQKKKKGKKWKIKIKNTFKINKLFLYVFLNSFNLFSFII